MTDQKLAEPPESRTNGEIVRSNNSDIWELLQGSTVLTGEWWSESDFQVKLLVLLVFWLTVNLLLIQVAWRVYGDRITDVFMKGSSEIPSNATSEKRKTARDNFDPFHTPGVPEQHMKRD